MSEPEKKENKRRLLRCTCGNIYDTNAHDKCPSCGALPERGPIPQEDAAPPVPEPEPAPPTYPAWLKPVALGGGGLLVVLTAVLLIRGSPPPHGRADAAVSSRTASQSHGSGKVERWQTVLTVGGRQYVCTNTTQPDGRYRLGDGCPPPFAGETGQTTVKPDGHWVTHADTGRTDSGTIETISPDKFIAHSAAGDVVWTRVKSHG